MRYNYSKVLVPEGKHEIIVYVYNPTGIPALYVEGETVISDSSWEADATLTYYGGKYLPVGYWNLGNKNVTPTNYTCPTKKIIPIVLKKNKEETVFDFKKEIYLKLVLKEKLQNKKYKIYYGESIEEAYSNQWCVQKETIITQGKEIILSPKACRYVRIVGNLDCEVFGLKEYWPKRIIGDFKSDDKEINKIYDISKYTYDLTAGLFLLMG